MELEDYEDIVVNLEDTSDNTDNLSRNELSKDVLDNMQSHISKEVAGQIWQAGKQSTQKLISTYAHIDFLRPFFDVEPKVFRNRLVRSFIPSKSFSTYQELPSELYGPLMLTFSLVAIILYGMKSSGHEVEEGTLIGTAMAVCFGYWLGVSSLLFFIAYLSNAQLTNTQILSLTGYSMSGHCIVLLISTVCDHYGNPGMFYSIWLFFGSLSGLRPVSIYVAQTETFKKGAVLGTLSMSIHMLSILYLRLEYHKVYEALSEVFS